MSAKVVVFRANVNEHEHEMDRLPVVPVRLVDDARLGVRRVRDVQRPGPRVHGVQRREGHDHQLQEELQGKRELGHPLVPIREHRS